ncbi:Dabb family protein [Acrocarpospora catenulata]|uniref:Dabb family protein n=1 Tax=Acrocarpospora catenulata TaxID=2836182 RepID=UPI001BD981F8|nr:Dabb family protein [Acrocarpospora catenulata]
MIKHVVLFKLKPGVSWEDPIAQRAERMAARVGEEVGDLLTWQAARNISPRAIAYDFLVVGTVADEDALDRYLVHPFHQQSVRLWREISDWVMVDVVESDVNGGIRVHAV